MKIKVRPDPSHAHYAPTAKLLQQIANMDTTATPAAIKLHGRKRWLWGTIDDVSPARGVFTVHLMESRDEYVLDIHQVEIMALHDVARRFVERCDTINAYVSRHGVAAARQLINSPNDQVVSAFDRLHPVPTDDEPPPAA